MECRISLLLHVALRLFQEKLPPKLLTASAMPSEAHPLTEASASIIDEFNDGVAELKEVPKSDKKLAAEPITEAYVKLSTVQWEWGRRLPKWQVSLPDRGILSSRQAERSSFHGHARTAS